MQDFLSKLNRTQRAAAEEIFGPVLVAAGPGTGKTQLLTSRIVEILEKTDGGAESILCLTFTENGAKEMQARLQKWIGAAAFRLTICTFHAFCQKILDTYPEIFGLRFQNSRVADDLEKAIVFRKTIDGGKWNYFRPFGDPYFWQAKVLKAISDLKRENVSPENLAELVALEQKRMENDPQNFYARNCAGGKKGEMKKNVAEKIQKWGEKMVEFSVLWQQYEKNLQAENYFDFDDQVAAVVREIAKNEDLKHDLQERYQFILVDEYQDTNRAQNEILFLLGDFDQSPNLFCVGDADQSIFRFQGANVGNIGHFHQKYPQTKTFSLEENYRSAQQILDAAFGVIVQNKDRIDGRNGLRSAGQKAGKAGKIFRGRFLGKFGEGVFLADKIREKIDSGVAPNEIAVICRQNRAVKEVAEILQKFGIVVAADFFQNILDAQEVCWLEKILRVLQSPQKNERAFLELLHGEFWPNQVSNSDLWTLSIEFSPQNSIYSVAEKNLAAGKILAQIQEWRRSFFYLAEKYPRTLAEKVWHDSGLAKYAAGKKDAVARLGKVRKFLEVLEDGGGSLESKLARIELHRELAIAIAPDPLPADRKSVQILTAHRSKGSEFEIVFVPGVCDGVWGNRRRQIEVGLPPIGGRGWEKETLQSPRNPTAPTESFSDEKSRENEEERRLFFVALTRAKSEIYLTGAQKDHLGREKNPSIFWHEIPENLVSELETEVLDARAAEVLPAFLGESPPKLSRDEREILRARAAEFVWSFTSLQAFLECPKKFLYLHLIRVPAPKNKVLALGVAIHRALEEFFSRGEKMEKTFKTVLERQGLGVAEREVCCEKGLEILKNYIDSGAGNFSAADKIQTELEINGKIGEIKVFGKVDLVDLGQNLAIDFKSGKPKSIKSGDRFWRQLVFYDLLFRGGEFGEKQMALEFLGGEKIERKFLEITDNDRAIVAAELKNANNQLQNLEFPNVENAEKDPEIEYWQNFGRG